ncbi:MAG TPA: TetR/AcrR family transcriptional regulator [Acidimicrobiales bacterium]|nr:TetR/AcrR family transcriptional regulator [Acidimicrobiales bacterium]
MSPPTSTPTAAGARRKRKPSRKDQLLKVAVHLFYERGFHETGIDDIGQAAGITGPGIYRHFTGKDDILSTALELGISQILHRVDDIVSHAATPEDTLRQLIRNFIRATLNDPELASILLNDRRVFTPETRQMVDDAERHHFNQWIKPLKALRPDIPAAERRMRVYATAGLLAAVIRAPARVSRTRLEALMQEMAEASLLGDRPGKRASSNGAAASPARRAAGRAPRLRRRDVILNVAAEMFAERGYVDTGIDEIGTAAGITGPGIYRHFAGKEDLLQSVIDQAVEHLLLVDQGALTAEGKPEVVFRNALVALVNEVRNHPAHARVAWNEQRSLAPDARARLLEFNRNRARQWVAVLARVRPEQPNTELFTMITGLYGMIIEGSQHAAGVSEERARELLVDMALRVGVPR